MTTQLASPAPYRLTFGHLLRSETIKLTTLRSPWWSALIVVILSVGISFMMATSIASYASNGGSQMAVNVVLMPTTFTVLLATIIGAMQSSGEYSTGMILASTTAAPGRIGNILAKALTVAGFVFALSLVTFALSAVLTAPILASVDIALDWSDPGQSWLPIIVGALAMAVFAVIGLSCGYLLRSPAGSMAVAIGIVFVLPIIPGLFAMMPGTEWIVELARYLPTNAFQTLVLGADDQRIGAGIALALWAVVPLIAAMFVVKRRDA